MKGLSEWGNGAPATGGSVSQSASINQSASSTGGGSVSQEASINQSANSGGNDGFFI
jgi:hypothetical protein